MKRLIVSILISCLVLGASCSTKMPHHAHPERGIVAIPVQATNTSRMAFYRYYKIYTDITPVRVIKIFPRQGEMIVYSKELPAGEYNFNKIKIILNGNVAYSKQHTVERVIPEGLQVTIKPGYVTIPKKKLYIRQFDMKYSKSWDWAVRSEWRFEVLTDAEVRSLIYKINSDAATNNKLWKIANEL